MGRQDKSPTNQFLRSPFEGKKVDLRARGDSVVGLNRLIVADDLSVVFQPIVELSPPRVFAYEALLRCRLEHFRDPTVLFRRALEEGCTGRLGRMIREVAVPLCAGTPVFLNVHPVELQERWLVRPDDPIYFHDHDVYIEVTESVPLQHFELCRDVLAEMQARGDVKLVVDDLGAGYSNLKYIADLQPRIVKLDRELVRGLPESVRQRKLVAGIVNLCLDLGAEVVAEGIETHDEAMAVRDSGVQYAQGYYFARPAFPLPAVERATIAL